MGKFFSHGPAYFWNLYLWKVPISYIWHLSGLPDLPTTLKQLAGTKRKYEEIIDSNKCNIQLKDNTINKLKTDNAQLEKQLEQV